MYLNHTQQGKIDPLLQDALERAKGKDVLRVVMVLGAKQEENDVALSVQPPDPARFPTRKAYRQALIRQRQQVLSETLGTTLESLRNLSLRTYGGMTSRLVVTEGTAQQILQALTLEGVQSASLDQAIRVEESPPPDKSVKAFLSLFAEVLPDLQNNQRLRQSVAKAISFYMQTYQERHGRLKVLGMREPVSLESIYTSVQFLEKADLCQFESLEAIESSFRNSQKRGFQPNDCKKNDGLSVANTEPLLMVLGGPGSGKSTFLRRVGWEALKGHTAQYQHSLFPIFIELKRFTAGIDLSNVIVEQLRDCQFSIPDELARKLLEQGKLLILLDGLDEISTRELDVAIHTIQEFINKYKTNRFIGSCRTAAYRSYFSQFTEVVMADFGPAQIRQFIQNWFQSPKDLQYDTAKKFWNLLEKTDSKALRELAQTPLLLTFLCLVFDNAGCLPQKRATLYKKALNILLENWSAEKRIQRDPIYGDFSIALEEMMLAELAYHTFKEDRLFFTRQEAAATIQNFLAQNLNSPENLNVLAVLNAIEVQQGILVERGRDVLSFSHLTLQEFLAAKYSVDHGLTEKLVQEHVTDTRWREVFVLAAGLESKADFLLQTMAQKAQSYIARPHLKSLRIWAEQKTAGSVDPHHSAARKTLALAVALDLKDFNPLIHVTRKYAVSNAHALALALDPTIELSFDYYIFDRPLDLDWNRVCALHHTNAIDLDRAQDLAINTALNYALDRALIRAHALDKNKIFSSVNFSELIAQHEFLIEQAPYRNSSFDSRKEVLEELRSAWFKALHLDPAWIEFSYDELVTLGDYFYVCVLMLHCKDAAISVSRSVWSAIVENLMRVEPEDLGSKPDRLSLLGFLNPFKGVFSKKKVGDL